MVTYLVNGLKKCLSTFPSACAVFRAPWRRRRAPSSPLSPGCRPWFWLQPPESCRKPGVTVAWVRVCAAASLFMVISICVSLEKNARIICPFHSWVIYPFMVDLQDTRPLSDRICKCFLIPKACDFCDGPLKHKSFSLGEV